jgi:hypothetical protein
MHNTETRQANQISKRRKFPLFRALFLIGMAILLYIVLSEVAIYFKQPPGYADWGSSSKWTKDNIGYFLNVPIPENAINLEIEGKMGLRGSLGIAPQLSFSFHTPPENSAEFVSAFCDGVLHPGYNPLIATDSSIPTKDSVFILGQDMMHYSRSSGVPDTIKGNRCVRYDERWRDRVATWIEEIVIDTSNPDEYVVSYHLSLANFTYAYYPTARYVAPFGSQFQLYVIGLRKEVADTDEPLYIVENHTICLTTSAVSEAIWDYFAFTPGTMDIYHNSDVIIFIGEIEQPPARIVPHMRLFPSEFLATPDLWEYYCLDSTVWEQGTHTMQLIVEPDDGEALTLEWEFEVR